MQKPYDVTEVARLPFVYRHLAVMPDVHLGKLRTAIEKAVPLGHTPGGRPRPIYWPNGGIVIQSLGF